MTNVAKKPDLQEAVLGFVQKNKDPSQQKKIMRWNVIGGLCLLHGYRKGAELGVSQGRFTMYLCALMHDMEVDCFDLWAEQPNNEGEMAEQYLGWPHEENYQRFKNLAEQYFPERIKIHRMDSAKGADLIEDGSLDFVFIDADHSHAGCLRDLQAWYPKVRKGGIVAGHDWHWPTVQTALKEFGKKVAISHDHVWVHFKND